MHTSLRLVESNCFTKFVFVIPLLIVQTLWPGQASYKATKHEIIVTPVGIESGLIGNLAKDQIELEGIRGSIISVQHLSGPFHIVILFDVSASTREIPGRKKNVFSTTHQFVSSCGTLDFLALHAFGSKHRVLVPFCQDPIKIQAELDRMASEPDLGLINEFGGKTDYLRALGDLAKDSNSELRFGDSIVIITDGEIQITETKKLEKIQRDFIRQGIRVFLLRPVEFHSYLRGMPGGRVAAFGREVEAQQKAITVPVGGAVVNPQGPVDLSYSSRIERPLKTEWISDAAGALLSLIRNAFRVDLEIHEPLNKPRNIKLKYHNSNGTRGYSIQLLYPIWISPEIKE